MRNYALYKYIWWIAAIVLTWAFFFSPKAISGNDNKSNELVVNVVPLKKQSVEITNQYVGYVTPIKSVNVVPNVSGYVDEVWAEGGINVKAGDNLVLIDQREYKADMDLAIAQQEQAKADFNNARSYYERVRKAGTKAIAPSVIDEAKAKFLAAEAALKQAKAQSEKAKVMLDYTVLQAPIDGVIGEISLTKGDYVAPNGNALFSIVQFDPIRVKFAISDKEYLTQVEKHKGKNLFEDESIRLKLANGQMYPLKGTFKYMDNQLNKTTNSVTLFVDFENKDKILAANSYVDVLVGQKLDDVYLIRQNYVNISDSQALVNIVKKGKISQVPLQIVGYYGDYYAVSNKFLPDEFLVIDKLSEIDNNTKITMKIAKQIPENK